MNNKPLVTIIIPTYKRTWEYLYRSVSSVLNQTYDNIELIVIDDSPDSYENRSDIKEKMAALVKNNPKVKYLVNERNLGGSLARNRGTEVSTGQYITFLDDDDEYLQESGERKDTNQRLVVSFSNCFL